ncbi:manganese and iron superoxide dismutase [Ceraceosorus guamensis]|uniref:Manganese and iron superoxide dismutase n=1 Tax=Ceraceosorus guamensis TaxID=1522189 RepID=A0A316VVM5_9BASI|nr:manganese and iron superoxide dismutase [Ceraceosorus guamensis]PWN41344.1 manganese and iron superoxide dismutase [Ceraceosorus guamensis]
MSFASPARAALRRTTVLCGNAAAGPSRPGLSKCRDPRTSSSSSSPSLLQGGHAQQRSQLHSLPHLPAKLSTPNACYPLFGPTTLDLIWKAWQNSLLRKVNDLVQGTDLEDRSIVDTVIATARDPHRILIFNAASHALNNAFFINGLRPKPLEGLSINEWADIPPFKPKGQLLDAITKEYDSLPAFKDAFSATADGMSGSGYVWLVRDAYRNLGIVPTYGAGTVMVQNRIQRGAHVEGSTPPSVPQGEEQPAGPSSNLDSRIGATSVDSGASGSSSSTSSALSNSRLGSYGTNSSWYAAGGTTRVQRTGEELYPLFCISIHEHTWLPDYGMEGKDEYLARFWEVLDWERVGQLYDAYNRQDDDKL